MIDYTEINSIIESLDYTNSSLDPQDVSIFKQSLQECLFHGTRIHNPSAILTHLSSAKEVAQKLSEDKASIIFDLDDTLITNSSLYVKSKNMLIEFLAINEFIQSDTQSKEVALQLFEARDHANIPIYGFNKFRWFDSIHGAAEELAMEVKGRSLLMSERLRLDEIAAIPFNQSCLFPDTRVVMRWLIAYGVPIYVLTKGEEGAQRTKLHRHGIHTQLNDWWATPVKNKTVLQSFIRRREITNPIILGDSLKSDIAPAKELGLLHALIRYHHDVWSHENDGQNQADLEAGSITEALIKLSDL